MRSYSFKTMAHRIITWVMVLAIAFGTFQTTALTQAAAPNAPNEKKVDRTPRPDQNGKNLQVEEDPIGVSLKGAKGPVAVMIELQDDPVVVAQYATEGLGKTKNAQIQIAVNQKAKIEAAQTNTLNALKNSTVKYSYLYQVKNTYNGIAINADASNLDELAKLPGVKALHRLTPMKRNNAYSDGLIKAPVAWGSYGITGNNVKIGIIDTGIDYIHTNFGGRGLESDYTAAHPQPGPVVTVGGVQIYPTPKVVGGYDFAGDDYNADIVGSVPQPDQNPLDCAAALGGGHGSHVAGTAAGYGVNADGTTYTGPYNQSTDLEALRIGPGVAPGAKLYALRVFGCDGTTNLTEVAIDWAVDPDNNPATNDHLDIVNLSLGASFGSTDDPSAYAANNASLAGVMMVISAGNSGDTYYVNGSPGSAQRALTVANSGDAEAITDGFRVTTDTVKVYPGSRSALYPWETQTGVSVTVPVTAPLYYPSDPENKKGCAPFTGADAANISGTIVLLDWAAPGESANFYCGSVTRGNNAEAAHAKGIIMVSGVPYLDTSINGAAHIPAMFTVSTVGDALKAQLIPGVVSNLQTTLTNEYNNSVKLIYTGQNDTVDSSTSRGPQGFGNNLKPDIAAPGTTIFSTASGTGDEGETLSGTSMAAPHMAGVMALLYQKFPGWTVEEYKAAAMNTAAHDLFDDLNDPHTGNRYGQSRVGAGRVDVALAVADNNRVLAFNADNAGAVSVSFGSVEVSNTLTLTKNVKVENKGYADANYTLSYDGYVDIPGVTYTYPANVSVTAGSTITFQVSIVLTASQMLHTKDPTVADTQTTDEYVRNYLSEESGILNLTPTNPANFNTLRVPLYATAKAVSTMRATGALDFSGGDTVTPTLTGTPVSQSADPPTGTFSLVSPMELVKASPKLNIPSSPPDYTSRSSVADLQYIGITSNYTNTVTGFDSRIYIGLSTWADWTIPHYYQAEFDIYFDTNKDGVADYVAYNAPIADTNFVYDLTAVTVLNLKTGAKTTYTFMNDVDGTYDTNYYNNNVMVLPIIPLQLGLSSANSSFNYEIYTYDRFGPPGSIDHEGPFFYDAARPGLKINTAYNPVTNPKAYGVPIFPAPFFDDTPGPLTAITIDPASYERNGSQGMLLLHHHNLKGTRAEVVAVTNPQSCGPGAATSVNSNQTDNGSGTQCGTLSYALKAATGSGPTKIYLSPPANGKTLNFSGSTTLVVPANVTLVGGSEANPATGGRCDQENNIKLVNNIGNQILQLNGGDQLLGITLEGIHVQAKTSAAANGPNKLICVVIHPANPI